MVFLFFFKFSTFVPRGTKLKKCFYKAAKSTFFVFFENLADKILTPDLWINIYIQNYKTAKLDIFLFFLVFESFFESKFSMVEYFYCKLVRI